MLLDLRSECSDNGSKTDTSHTGFYLLENEIYTGVRLVLFDHLWFTVVVVRSPVYKVVGLYHFTIYLADLIQ